ncbi:hypothetical protein THTE_3515 [Thermogutta terrifontis]|uniref:Uncharacterized protein n=1 Tax=Thermogutta terrifontis TaxID=1331910 RepID=A0A286RJI5_9BACT|nr:hypothetical protein THTE_3515 [Thermogutta terrifontis]
MRKASLGPVGLARREVSSPTAFEFPGELAWKNVTQVSYQRNNGFE